MMPLVGQVKSITSWFVVVWRGWFKFPTSAKQEIHVSWNGWGFVGEEKPYNFSDDEEGNFQIL